jgi:pyrimidine-nucleoside phosphorylase/thymidine phosphorylase
MEEREDAVHLATTMCEIGRAMGRNVVALITRMDEPLGRAVGNAVEVAESVECLRGEGPPELTDLSIELAAEMVVLAGHTRSLHEARARCRQALAEGRALERFRGMVIAQGGNADFIEDPTLLPAPARRVDLHSPSSGIVQRLAARPIGHATMLLGAGRARVDSSIDPAVGVILHKKVGDPVSLGEPLCTLLVNDESRLDEVSKLIAGAYAIADEPATIKPLIVMRLGG